MNLPLEGISLVNLGKTYGDTVALAGLTLTAKPGEILGVAGPNGAGKSTMVKILASEISQETGEIFLNGETWDPWKHKNQVAVVHQEPQLFPNLTVAENIMVGIERSKFVKPTGDEVDPHLLEEVGLSKYANRLLGDLPMALQQRTEIAHALARSADVFLFDEPNSALTEEESKELFEWMHNLANNGKIVILVSHRLSELAAHCDRIVVIIDGVARTEIIGNEISEERIAQELITQNIMNSREIALNILNQTALLKINDWNHKDGVFKSVDLEVRTGEILAVIGVEGSGGRELVRSLAGFAQSSGTLHLIQSQANDKKHVISFVSGDRASSLFTNFSVGENLFIRVTDRITGKFRTLSRSHSRKIADAAVSDFLVKTASIDTPIRSLSGGNQQKVAIASALALNPRMIALEEPTRGVDISSKAEIYRLVRQYVSSGSAAVFYCTEVAEVFESSDRVVVIAAGKIQKILNVYDYVDAKALAHAITEIRSI